MTPTERELWRKALAITTLEMGWHGDGSTVFASALDLLAVPSERPVPAVERPALSEEQVECVRIACKRELAALGAAYGLAREIVGFELDAIRAILRAASLPSETP